MALSFGFFSDPALTTPFAGRLSFFQDAQAPVGDDKVIYLGSPDPVKVLRAASDPGVDPITLTVADSAAGSGSPAGDVRLALSAGELASATGGAALSLGVQINGGAANAVAIHVRVLDSTGVSALNQDLSLLTNNLREF